MKSDLCIIKVLDYNAKQYYTKRPKILRCEECPFKNNCDNYIEDILDNIDKLLTSTTFNK